MVDPKVESLSRVSIGQDLVPTDITFQQMLQGKETAAEILCMDTNRLSPLLISFSSSAFYKIRKVSSEG